MEMKRGPQPLVVDVSTSAAGSTEIEKGFQTTGSIQLPSGSGTTEITVYAKLGGNDYAIAENDLGGAIKMEGLTAGKPRMLPPEVYNFPRIKLVASAGTATSDVSVWLTT